MIVFDTETTGLPKPEASKIDAQPQIIEFAAIKLDDESLEEVDRIEFFANPGKPLPAKIIEITGITDGQLKDEKPFAANFNALAKFFLGEKSMVAHNLAFDRNLMRYELIRLDKVCQFPWPIDHLCTVELTNHIKGHRLKLSMLHQMATGSEFEGAHRAMVDVEALVRCVKWLREQGVM